MTRGGGWIILLTFVVAVLLDMVPLPEWAQPYRPAWSALVLIYWCMALPQRVGVITALIFGLFLDLLTGTLFGQHALGLVIVAYLANRLHRRTRVLPLWQQAITIFMLLMLNSLLLFWIRGIIGLPTPGMSYWASPVTSTLLWPWIYIVLRDIRRQFGVA